MAVPSHVSKSKYVYRALGWETCGQAVISVAAFQWDEAIFVEKFGGFVAGFVAGL